MAQKLVSRTLKTGTKKFDLELKLSEIKPSCKMYQEVVLCIALFVTKE
jgi:hypothetical protein